MEDLSERIQEAIASYSPSVLGAILVLVIGWLVARLLAGLDSD